MDEPKNHIMVALLPTETFWSTLDYPHLTLVYAGTTLDHPNYVHSELLKKANLIAKSTPPFYCYTNGVAVFGPEDDQVDVVVIKSSPRLYLLRAQLVEYNKSEYTEFRPHCTIGPVGSRRNNIPEAIKFDRIVVAWGSDRMVYQLNGY